MREKFQTQAFERVRPILQPGEQPIVATRAQVGGFSSGRWGPTVRRGLQLQGGAIGGAIAGSLRQQFVVLTNRRLIFLPQTFWGGPGRQVVGEVPREYVSLAEVRMGVVSLVRIGFGPTDGVTLTFPRIDKKNAEALAAALQPSAG